jgi:hypothetical protein
VLTEKLYTRPQPDYDAVSLVSHVLAHQQCQSFYHRFRSAMAFATFISAARSRRPPVPSSLLPRHRQLNSSLQTSSDILRNTVRPGLTSDGSTVTAQSDSNVNGLRHPHKHGAERCAACHGRCRTVKDRLGVKGSHV